MSVTVYIPSPFRSLTGNRSYVEGHGDTVEELLRDLGSQYPALRDMLRNETDEVPAHINIYVNNQEMYSLRGMATPLKDGDEVAVIPAIAGGQVLTPDQVLRYSRHIIMPQVGPLGQRKLMAAKVLVIGAGGLGSPAAVYLALAGVGTLGIVDFDVVELSNLQRQILHSTETIGKPKLESAKDRLRALNPNVEVATHELKLTSENALGIFKDYDVIADGTDNFPTRYLINDACVLTGKPNVFGSIFRFEGQASVFWGLKGPCYRCLYPEPPPPGEVPSCAEAGVFGVLPGIIGSIQAVEAIKLLLGIGEPLVGRLLLYDALDQSFRTLNIQRDPTCPLCGEHPTVTELIDYEQFCGLPSLPTPTAVVALPLQTTSV